MTARRDLDPQLDLFVPILSNLELRDARDTMERPFFSLSKSKRLTPIQYASPDGTVHERPPTPGLRHGDYLGR